MCSAEELTTQPASLEVTAIWNLTTKIWHFTGGPYLPFLGLGNTSGVNQVFLPHDLGGASNGISIPGGLPFGSINKTSVYVSSYFVPFSFYVNVFIWFAKISKQETVKILRRRWGSSHERIFSPVYTGRLNRFRIRINLNRIRVNALIRIVNQFTQPTSGCELNPGWNRISLEGGACKQLVQFLSGLSAVWRSCQYSWQVVQPISHRSASCERRFMS